MNESYEIYVRKGLPPLVAYCILFLVFISTFRIFATLPFEELHQTVSTASIIIFSIYYLFSLFNKFRRRKITKLDILMWVYILVNFMTAYKGKEVFGQPYYFGIMAQRSVLLCLSGFLLLALLEKQLVTIRQVEKSFVIISITLLLICYYFFLFVDPSRFANDEFVSYSSIRGYRYRFQFGLIIMLLFYSLFKISNEKKSRYGIIVALVLFYFIYFLQSRTTLVVLIITLAIYFYRNFSLREKVKKSVLYGSLLATVLVVLFTLGYTSLFVKYKTLYHNVVDAFVKDSPGEPSSAVRFMEYQTAVEYIAKNPLLGNGFVSNQWNGGFQQILGYFYPVDIGIMGNLFVFGLIGTILIYLPYYFSLYMSLQVKSDNVFFKSCEYMQLFLFFSMFFSAINIKDSSSIMFIVCLIYYYRYYGFSDEVIRKKPVLKPKTI